MKKKTIATAFALACVLATAPMAAACTTEHYSALKFAAQDTSYAVTSQGGSAVAYGNYVYFINGTRGYADDDGNNNVWGSAVKGGLYRAEINGSKAEGTPYNTFVSAVVDKESNENGLELKYTDGEDYVGDPLIKVNVDEIATKTVGTSGYENGGIFIYDNYVYFATPNNQKDKYGTVQVTVTDFFMMPLSGGSPKKIYTTDTSVDTSSSAYAFYKYGDKVYLVVNEGGTIVSVGITAKGKVEDPQKCEYGATSVYFPVRDTYYKGIDTNTLEDFIYIVRPVNEDVDKLKQGTVIEAMRPDFSENFVVSRNGNSETIEAVRDGIFFYRTTDTLGNSVIAYSSLYDALMDDSDSYAKAHQNDTEEKAAELRISGEMPVSSDVTQTYAFRPDTQSNEVYYIGVTDSDIRMYRADGSSETICPETGTIKFVADDYLFYKSGSDFFRVPLWSWINSEDYGVSPQAIVTGATSATLECDYAAGYFTYYYEVDKWADDYTYFCKLDGAQDLENGKPAYRAQFVGKIAKADQPTEDEIKEMLEEKEANS